MPFRWEISKREQLGALIEGPEVEFDDDFLEALRRCCARVVAFAGDSDFAFVGRSPESLFDYLSGMFQGTSLAERLILLQLSLRLESLSRLAGDRPAELAALHDYFQDLGLDPISLISRDRPVALIDFVASGSTFGTLVGLLQHWSKERRLDWSAVQRKLRIVGITVETKTSPKTWRWQQHMEWVAKFPGLKIKNVSAPLWFCSGFMNTTVKTTPSHHPDRWRNLDSAIPPREADNLEALRRAVALFDIGRSKDERDCFVAGLTSQREMRSAWFRGLVTELRNRRSRA